MRCSAGANPTAAETTASQPFKVWLLAVCIQSDWSHRCPELWVPVPVDMTYTLCMLYKVRFFASEPLVVTPRQFVEQQPDEQQLVLRVLHEALLNLAPPRPSSSGWMSGEERLVGRLQRRLLRAGPGCDVLLVRGRGVTAVVVANRSQASMTVQLTAYTKSNVARTTRGKLVSDTAAGAVYFEKIKAAEERANQATAQRHGGGSGGTLFKQQPNQRQGG